MAGMQSTLFAIIDETVTFATDERQKTVVLNYSLMVYTFVFPDILDFMELVRILTEAKTHLATVRDERTLMLNLVRQMQFPPYSPHYVTAPAATVSPAVAGDRSTPIVEEDVPARASSAETIVITPTITAADLPAIPQEGRAPPVDSVAVPAKTSVSAGHASATGTGATAHGDELTTCPGDAVASAHDDVKAVDNDTLGAAGGEGLGVTGRDALGSVGGKEAGSVDVGGPAIVSPAGSAINTSIGAAPILDAPADADSVVSDVGKSSSFVHL